jgi:ketosteroid isomerase-like protein
MSDDHIEVSSLFARLADLLDEARYDDIHTIYTDDVVVHSPQGGELRGIDEVTAFLHKTHVDGRRTQHLLSGVLVDVDGDRARASANELTYFYRDGEPPHRTGGLRMTWEAVRTPLGWRVREARLAVAWIQEGSAATAG